MNPTRESFTEKYQKINLVDSALELCVLMRIFAKKSKKNLS